MKKLFTTFLICTALGSLTAQEMTVDGLSTDWSKDLLTVDKKTNLTTAVRNDAEYLYILFQADNTTSITKMLQAGMEITFKAKVKPKVNAKIEFPLEAARGEATQRGGQRQRGQGQGGQGQAGQGADRAAQLKARLETQLETKNQAKLKGFSVSNGQLLLADLEGIQTGLAFDDSEKPVLNYELRVPLSELYGASMDWDKITAKDLDINIKVNGIDSPQGAGGNVGAGGGGGGGRGGAGGGGGRGGGGGGRGGAGGGAGRGGAGAGTSNQGGTSMFTDQVIKLSYRIVK